MKNSRILIVLFSLLVPLFPLIAQEDRDKTLLANDMFKVGDVNEALVLYKGALEINPTNVEANFMAGRCLVQTTCCRKDAVERFKKTLELDPTFNTKIFFYIGDAFHKSQQFDSAIVYYQQYKQELEVNRRDYLGVDVDAEIVLAERRMFECANGKDYLNRPFRIKIENMGSVINSVFEDYAPAISSNNDEIFFTSKREGSIGDKKNTDNKFFEDIWYSTLANGSWTTPTNLAAPVNDDGHNSAISLSPNGKRLFIYSAENSGDIYYSDKNTDGTWNSPKPSILLNTPSVESSISITSDGKMMFYTSSKEGGLGAKDIYYCDLNAALECIGSPKNIGSKINSSFDEEAPFYDIKNNILYFASKGHKGMGGYDLYESSYSETSNTWSDPINLGMPVNSTDDDVFMSLTADGQTGYYATYKEDSYGGNDIYKIVSIHKILEEEVPYAPDTSTSALATNALVEKTVMPKSYSCKIEIKLVDENNKPLEGKTEIYINGESKMLYAGNTTNGSYIVDFEYKENQKLLITSEAVGYFFQNNTADIGLGNDASTVQVLVQLKPIQKLEIRPLRNIYFGFDKHTLTPSSFAEINKLYNMMVASPKIHIEIAGHTDFIGGDAYNAQLSQARASAVRNALIKKGISANRIKAVGYGEDHPLATNDDDQEGRELNRRTEFIIIPH